MAYRFRGLILGKKKNLFPPPERKNKIYKIVTAQNTKTFW